MRPIYAALRSLSLFASLSSSLAADSAWNGHVSPGSTTPSKFTPFYVPSGSEASDSASQSILYVGAWRIADSAAYTDGSAMVTTAKGAYATFDFTGAGIEFYGGKGKRYGQADIYIDGKFERTIDNWDSKDQQQQLLFFLLQPGTRFARYQNCQQGFKVRLTSLYRRSPGPMEPGNVLISEAPSEVKWSLLQKGSTGVAAMQLAIISSSHAIIIDKVEHNPLTIDGHPAWGALYNLNTHSVKALNIQSNSFCAGGSFLSNGTLINVGGNPVVTSITAAADFGDVDGLQAIRLFHPCESESVSDCDIYENHARIRMASPRWYNTVVRISDGSAMIIGGSKKGGWINNATTNNPTVEYYPPKGIHGSNGDPITLAILQDTLNSNLFPIAFSLSDGNIFLAANQDATIYNWQANSEQRLPQIPNGVRVTYPMTGTGLLLPLSPENNYASEILLCGGSSVDDTKPGYLMNSQDPASSQCSRIVLTDEGISAGWQVEQMPQARIMPDAVLLPTGQIFIANGGATGISGYANVIDQVGQSNADNPVLTPVLYDPTALAGQRFSSVGMPTSQIPRLYHSVATLTPNGEIMIAGSNPNLDRSEVRYGTEYRVEWMIDFGEKLTLKVHLPSTTSTSSDIKVACMDLGYVTHAVHANSRLVYLVNAPDASDAGTLSVTGPPNANVYPPGPAWIFLVVDGVPSIGTRVMIGDGKGPEVDEAALNNVLENTQVDQYEKDKGENKDNSE
ncbi:hypothetical protein EW145_g2082 [Phellinidium pouzarii]|uniref:Glyoxal oxidase N-terminal domain-containing protein n=1 Tax=Phellinidium pouzarii TaxID=167371 RepID=A0A4S4LC62_9AGAM|nr:hypothetical protein EW145_g2082 [Phellinidium pouzarii]